MSDRKLTKSEEKLLNSIGEKLTNLASSKLDTEDEIQALERFGFDAGRLAEWLEKEQVDEELDEVKCVMICEALGEAVGKYKM